MRIRKGKKQDIKICLDIEYPKFCKNKEIAKNILTKQIKDKRFLFLVADVNGRVKGFITARRAAWNNSFYIERLFVEKSQRSKGYGSKLVTEVARNAKQLKARIIFVDILPKNKRGIKFYLRNGFRRAGAIKELFDSKRNRDALILSYKL